MLAIVHKKAEVSVEHKEHISKNIKSLPERERLKPVLFGRCFLS